MAKSPKSAPEKETREETFQRVVMHKLDRIGGPLMADKMSSLSDDQWAVLFKLCGGRPRQALLRLVLAGLKAILG